MSIKVLKKKERQPILYDGSSMEKAYAWSYISASGTSGTIPTLQYADGSYCAWVAVSLIATQEYTSNYGGYENKVELYDAEGTKVAESNFGWDDEQGTDVEEPLSYTPVTGGTYYLKFKTDYYDTEYGEGISVNFSPRPADPDRPLWMPYETSEGLDAAHLPVKYQTAEEAGIRFDGTPITGLVYWCRALKKSLRTLKKKYVSYSSLQAALQDAGISIGRVSDNGESLVVLSENGQIVVRINQGGSNENGLTLPPAKIMAASVRFRLKAWARGNMYPILNCPTLLVAINTHENSSSGLPSGVNTPEGLHEQISTSVGKVYIRMYNKTARRTLSYYWDGDTKHYSWGTDNEHEWHDDGLYDFDLLPEQYIGSDWHTVSASYWPHTITSSGDMYGGLLRLWLDGECIMSHTLADNDYVCGGETGSLYLGCLLDGGSSKYAPIDIDLGSLRIYTRPTDF